MSALDVVVVPDFRPEVSPRYEARTLFFLASWLEHAGAARDFPLHLACIGEPPRSVRWLAERCQASVTVHEPVGAEERGSTNKLRGLEVAGREDGVLLLDADMLVLSDFSELADMTGCIAAAPAARPRVPDRYWDRIYPALGLPVPEQRMASLVGELDCSPDEASESDMRRARAMHPYHNAAVVLSPWGCGLRDMWEDHVRRIAGLFRPEEPKAKSVLASDMAGFATAIAQLERDGTPFRRLPDVYNVRALHFGAGAIEPREAKVFHAVKFGREMSSPQFRAADLPRRYERWLGKVMDAYRGPGVDPEAGRRGAQAIGDVLGSLYVAHVMPALSAGAGRRGTPPPGPVVIGCLGGSGSRVFQQVLEGCPEVYMDQNINPVNRDSRGTSVFRWKREFDDPEYRREVTRFVEAVIGQIDPGQATDYRWFGFKEPQMIWHAAPFLERYPQSRFVHVIRDPRTVLSGVTSDKRFRRHRENGDPAAQGDKMGFLLDQWAEGNLRAWRGHGENPRYRLVRFEELLASPEPTIAGLLDWLGLDDAVLPRLVGLVDPPPDALTRGHDIDVSRIAGAVRELGYSE